MRASINRFGQLSGLIKKVKRTGWLRYLPSQHVESVGDHSSKIAFLSLFLRGIQNIDSMKCLQMALVHDIAEGIVGDFTPYCKITPQQKFQRQRKAFRQIFSEMNEQNCKYYENIWLQYEQGQTYEAKIVKDLDKLQMIQQAFQYEKDHGIDLSQFYKCIQKLKTQLVKQWAEELYLQRNQFKQNMKK